MLIWLGLAAAITTARPQRSTTDLGACAWQELPSPDRASFLDAYHRGISSGMAALSKRDADIRLAAARCAGSAEIPIRWLQAAFTSEAIQQGAAQEVAHSNISRAALAYTWDHAPEEARQCARANAAKVFGITGQPCADPRATASFVRDLGVDVAANGAVAAQILIFMNAHAQGEWANSLIEKQLGRS